MLTAFFVSCIGVSQAYYHGASTKRPLNYLHMPYRLRQDVCRRSSSLRQRFQIGHRPDSLTAPRGVISTGKPPPGCDH